MSEIRIGSRILNDEELSKLLPNNINNEIKVIRETAKSVGNSNSNSINNEYSKTYCNVFSILGGRGSGKTSVLLTIKSKIENYPCGEFNTKLDTYDWKVNEDDTILPLIEPDTMGIQSEVLGWLIGTFRNVVEKIENDIYERHKYIKDKGNKDYFRECRKLDENKLRRLYNELLINYRYTQKDYTEIIKNEYDTFNSYIDNVSNILDAEQRLIIKFYEFIDEIICIKRSNEIKEEPLIFIFLDDVDLSSNRCEEVLNVVSRYLSHPNIIVFIAGEYKAFSKTLLLNNLKMYDATELIINNDFENTNNNFNNIQNTNTILKSSMILAEDTLKKILPPTLRNDIPILNTMDKYEFKFNNGYTLGELVYKIFVDGLIDEKLKKNTDNNKNEIIKKLHTMRFLKEIKENDKSFTGKINEAFFSVFDNTPRGLLNVYYLLSSSENKEIDYNTILKRFIDVAIKSSNELKDFEEDIYEVIITRDEIEKYFFDYKKLTFKLQNNIKMREQYIKIFIFTVFIENIVSVFDDRSIHGSDIINQLFNDYRLGLKIYPELRNPNLAISMYLEISPLILKLNTNNMINFNEKNYFLLQYFERIEKIAKQIGCEFADFFNIISEQDILWTREKIEVICGQSQKEYILMNTIINNILNTCINMKADEEFIITLRSTLNSDIDNIHKEKFEEDVNNILISYLENKYKDILNFDLNSIEKRFKELALKIQYKFSSNNDIIYCLDNFNVIQLNKTFNAANKVNVLPIYIQNSIGTLCKEGELNAYEYGNLISNLDYLKRQQPTNFRYKNIYNLVTNCIIKYIPRNQYDISDAVEKFAIYVWVSFLNNYTQNIKFNKEKYYETFEKWYVQIRENSNSIAANYAEEYVNNYKVRV